MKPEFNQYLVITTLPRWVLEWVDTALKFIALLTGHVVIMGSVRDAKEPARD